MKNLPYPLGFRTGDKGGDNESPITGAGFFGFSVIGRLFCRDGQTVTALLLEDCGGAFVFPLPFGRRGRLFPVFAPRRLSCQAAGR